MRGPALMGAGPDEPPHYREDGVIHRVGSTSPCDHEQSNMSTSAVPRDAGAARPCDKRIVSPADLAINGAPPAFAEPIHVGRPNIANRARFLELVGGMLDRCWLSNDGPLVQEFERQIAQYLGVEHVVATCNGTIALEIAIRALGLTGEVIVPSYTFIATAHAVSWQGLTPVFADIDPATHCLDPQSVRSLITPRTSGVLAVHLWGRPAAIDRSDALGTERGLDLLVDAAHAFASSHGNRAIG